MPLPACPSGATSTWADILAAHCRCPFAGASGSPGGPSPGLRILLRSGCQPLMLGGAGGVLGSGGDSSVGEYPFLDPAFQGKFEEWTDWGERTL